MTDENDFGGDPPSIVNKTEAPGDTVRVRVVGLPFMTSFTCGDITITREWTEVPADQVGDLITEARKGDITLEVESE
jgi:hypothetical protein